MIYEKRAAERWSKRIEAHKASEKNAKMWCKENHVSYKSFLKWHNRLSSPEIKKDLHLLKPLRILQNLLGWKSQ